MTTITTDTATSVLQKMLDLINAKAIPSQDIGAEFTTTELAAANGWTYNRMAAEIKRRVDEGELIGRDVRTPDGHDAMAYRKVTTP